MGMRPVTIEKCHIVIETLEDLLETATSERDKARDEATKADRETLALKQKNIKMIASDLTGSYEVICYYRNLATTLGATPEQLLER